MLRSPILLERLLLACLAACAACWIPTDACGCTPARSVVYVRGTLTDAAGRAVAGARVYFEDAALPQTAALPFQVSGPGDAQTDAGGAFGGRAYSGHSPGTLTLHVAVVRAGLPDTVRLTGGKANFRSERDRPDTVTVALRLP